MLAATFCCGQYTYFNVSQLPPDYLNGNSGMSSNLIVLEDELLTMGNSFVAGDGPYRYHLRYDLEGNLNEAIGIDLPENDLLYPMESDALWLDTEGYMWGGGYRPTGFNYPQATCQHRWLEDN